MSVFLIAEVKVTNDEWVPEYAANVHKIVEKYGGKYFSRSGNITTLEGPKQDCTLIAIIAFPSKEALEKFVNSAEYQPYGNARRAGSSSRLVMIDDTDIAGAIPYLKAAQA
jgi:uncharacterized protein (DUF1330 family)